MAERLTSDKRRAEQYRRWTGGGPAEELAQALRADSGRATASGPRWTELGPKNIGGRLTCIAVEPGKPEHLWVGAAGGGVWVSNDGGASWATNWKNREDTLVIGSLVVDPDDARILYCGTGEANLSGDSDPGVGVFRWDDGGATWKPAGSSTDPRLPLPRHIGSLAIGKAPGPPATKTVWLAGIRPDDSEPPGGVYSSDDKGRTWSRHDLFGSDEPYQAHAVHAHGDEVLVGVTVERGGADDRAGIWRSADRGWTWSQVWSADDGREAGRNPVSTSPSAETRALCRFGCTLAMWVLTSAS